MLSNPCFEPLARDQRPFLHFFEQWRVRNVAHLEYISYSGCDRGTSYFYERAFMVSNRVDPGETEIPSVSTRLGVSCGT